MSASIVRIFFPPFAICTKEIVINRYIVERTAQIKPITKAAQTNALPAPDNFHSVNGWVHLTKACHQRVIESIIDKIDLDIDADFGYGQYVIMNDMESLYQELRERIIANKRSKVDRIQFKKWKKEYWEKEWDSGRWK